LLPLQGIGAKKMASYLHRTAQPLTLAAFRPWGSSAGAGRIRLAAANIGELCFIKIDALQSLIFKILFRIYHHEN